MKAIEKISISIVDDDEMFLKSLKHYLQEKLKGTIIIRLFYSGEDFLKHISEQKTDIVILDYKLNSLYPNAMDGRTALQKIKQTDPDMTVIMLSGQDKMNVALESIKDGAYDYIIKNDNAFLKTQTILKNAIETILISKRLKKYKWWITRILMLLAVALIIDTLYYLLKST